MPPLTLERTECGQGTPFPRNSPHVVHPKVGPQGHHKPTSFVGSPHLGQSTSTHSYREGPTSPLSTQGHKSLQISLPTTPTSSQCHCNPPHLHRDLEMIVPLQVVGNTIPPLPFHPCRRGSLLQTHGLLSHLLLPTIGRCGPTALNPDVIRKPLHQNQCPPLCPRMVMHQSLNQPTAHTMHQTVHPMESKVRGSLEREDCWQCHPPPLPTLEQI